MNLSRALSRWYVYVRTPPTLQVVSIAKGSTAYRAAPGLKCWGSWLPTQVPGRGTLLPHPLWVSPYHLVPESVWVSCVLPHPHIPQSAPPCHCRVCVCWRGVSLCRGERMPPLQFCCWPLPSAPLLRVLCPTYRSSVLRIHLPSMDLRPHPNIKLVRGSGESRA